MRRSVLTILAAVVIAGCHGNEPTASAVVATGSPLANEPRQVTQPAAAVLDPDVATTVDQVLTSAQHPGLTWGRIPDVVPVLKPLYDAEPDRLIWFTGTTPVATLEETLRTLANAGDHGLDPEDYDPATLGDQWQTLKAGGGGGADRALFDLGVSVAVARIIKGVHMGRVDPATLYWGYDTSANHIDVAAQLKGARDGAGLASTLDAVSPKVTHYMRARRTLAIYRAKLQAGEPAAVPDLPKGRTKLEAGAAWDGIPALAARLRALGDLPSDAAVAESNYSGALITAVKSFQDRHGLESDGVVGAGTIKAINVPLSQRVRQIELAMERMRWLPSSLNDHPNVFVNVPLFRMWATDPVTGDEPLRMNVVVGKALNHQTPIFIDRMEYVIFRPYWNPPQGITVQEIVPHIRRDPSYFASENLEIVATGEDNAAALPPTPENLSKVVAGRLHLRQKPGPGNSLGLAKFIFPNDDNVYMHGTPAQQLFSRARRDFSHGCIRVEDPARFAEWVLRDQPEWSRSRIDSAMKAERPTRVNLKQPLTVVLFYDTVHVNSEGVVFFVDDIYGHDKALDGALTRGYPYPSKS